MKDSEHVLLFCTVIMAERRKEYPRPSRQCHLVSSSPLVKGRMYVLRGSKILALLLALSR